MSRLLVHQETGFRHQHSRNHNDRQSAFHNCIWGFRRRPIPLVNLRGQVTLSQLHSPVAFLPQEHFAPWGVGTAVELWVVKSMGMEVISDMFEDRKGNEWE